MALRTAQSTHPLDHRSGLREIPALLGPVLILVCALDFTAARAAMTPAIDPLLRQAAAVAKVVDADGKVPVFVQGNVLPSDLAQYGIDSSPTGSPYQILRVPLSALESLR